MWYSSLFLRTLPCRLQKDLPAASEERRGIGGSSLRLGINREDPAEPVREAVIGMRDVRAYHYCL